MRDSKVITTVTHENHDIVFAYVWLLMLNPCPPFSLSPSPSVPIHLPHGRAATLHPAHPSPPSSSSSSTPAQTACSLEDSPSSTAGQSRGTGRGFPSHSPLPPSGPSTPHLHMTGLELVCPGSLTPEKGHWDSPALPPYAKHGWLSVCLCVEGSQD